MQRTIELLGFIARASGRLWFTAEGWTGLPGERPRLIVGNHSSPFDFLLGIATVGWRPSQVRYMVAKEYFRKPGQALVLRLLKAIPVDRNDGREALREALACLDEGLDVVIMPEGRIHSQFGEVGEFHAGVAHLARRSNAPIVLVVTAGLCNIWAAFEPLPMPRLNSRPRIQMSSVSANMSAIRDRRLTSLEAAESLREQVEVELNLLNNRKTSQF